MKIIWGFVLFLVACSAGSSQLPNQTEPVLPATLLFKVPVKQFFKPGAISQLPNNETNLKYLAPTALYVDAQQVYLPDQSRAAIAVYTKSGALVKHVPLPVNNLLLSKLIMNPNGSGAAVAVNSGAFFWNQAQQITTQQPATIDLYHDNATQNIYIENLFQGRRAIIDSNGLLQPPREITFHSLIVQHDTLYGLTQTGQGNLALARQPVAQTQPVKRKTITSPCTGCFVLPRFIAPALILSARDQPFTDQLTLVTAKGVLTYPITYPDTINTLISADMAEYAYTGYYYHYSPTSQNVYALATDNTHVYIYQISLSPFNLSQQQPW